MKVYITALVILIVAILFTVFQRVDGFFAVDGIKTTDLYGAVCGVDKALKASTATGTEKPKPPHRRREEKEKDQETPQETAPEPSKLSTKEMEDRIAKGVAKQLKDVWLSQRSTKPVTDSDCPYASYTSDAIQQGQELTQKKPDMSEYIRKDSIPCWNCSLP